MATLHELVLFDPFFGGVIARIDFASACSRTVFTDAERRTVFVLEIAAGSSPARVHAIEMSTGVETSHLDLPNPVEALWCVGDASSETFIAEYDATRKTAVRWVGLDPLTDRGSVRVGMPDSQSFGVATTPPVPMIFAAGQLFVATSEPQPPPLLFWRGNLTRCRATPSGLEARADDLGLMMIQRMAAVPDADRVLGGWGATDHGPAFSACEFPLSTVAAPTSLGPVELDGECAVQDVEPDGGDAWFVVGWEYHWLYRLDVAAHRWARYPFGWLYAPADSEVLRDVWNHEVWVSNVAVAPPVNIAPEILVVDELHSTARHIALQNTAEALHAEPLPAGPAAAHRR